LDQAVQIMGAVLILTAYAGSQSGFLHQQGYAYLLLNIVGSAVLAWLAAVAQQWGFLLLEGVWALVSVSSLIVRVRRGKVERAEAPH
jgi:hypothetical protein